MKKLMILLTVILTALFIASLFLHHYIPSPLTLSLAITLGTTAYHFSMRLAVGLFLHAIFRGNMDHKRKWFSERSFEAKLYRLLKVKAWKKYIPTFDPSLYSLKEHSIEELLGATCQAEVVHELIMLLSLLPLAMIIPFGEPIAFITTSLFAFLIDGVFVILQRFNRPRLLRLCKNT